MGKMKPSFASCAALALAGALIPAAALAQNQIPAPAPAPAPVQSANPNEVLAPHRVEADRLASEMRVLAESPRDMRALLSAADLSARLNDTSAALAFLARAENVDPTNARILAQRASVLVRIERPGEALRLFEQAEARGLPMAEYAADRGFAFDLLGAPDRAQRDYLTALDRSRDDETVRRYALSLGITGRVDEAMMQLDPLLRRSDRAAWRARAFILAMNGDVIGAEKIAASMMPGNMGLALTPFFRRLPSLSAADRAFAVHFGQLSPTPERRADAQLSPLGESGAAAAYLPQPRPLQGGAPLGATPLPAPPAFRSDPIALIDPLPPTVPVRQSRRARPPAPMPQTGIVQTIGGPAAASPAPRRMRVAPPPAPPKGGGDSLLAAIVADIDIPESELAMMDGGDEEVDVPAVEPAAVPPPVVRKPAPPVTKPARKPEPKPKPEAARIWVQVAGGANERTLPHTWRNLVKQAPAAFRGKSAWTVPLRATNRLLAGPFKSNGEAQSFVNQLKKEDIAAFVFTSEAGQKITKLEVK